MSHYGVAKDSSSESEPVSSGSSGPGESSSSGLSEPYGFSSGSSGMSGSTGSSESSGGSSSSGGGGGCSLVSNYRLTSSETEFIFDLSNEGTGAIEVTDMGFNEATPVFSPAPPFTIPEGGFVMVTMTTALPNTGGEVSVGNDCSGYLYISVP